MIKTGLLNPQILSLLARIRHTNTLVIADRGFPFWPMLETVDISLVDDIPTVLQVFDAIKSNYNIGQIYMASEFLKTNSRAVINNYAVSRGDILIKYEAHIEFKLRVPNAIGLIRTGDTIQYANMIIESA